MNQATTERRIPFYFLNSYRDSAWRNEKGWKRDKNKFTKQTDRQTKNGSLESWKVFACQVKAFWFLQSSGNVIKQHLNFVCLFSNVDSELKYVDKNQ